MSDAKYKVIEGADPEEILKNHPPIIYKYLDWNNLNYQRVLTHNELFFSSPRNFNDPFDCKIDTRYDLMSEDEKYNYFKQVSINYSNYHNLGWNEQQIHKEVERLANEHDFTNHDKVNSDNQYLFNARDNFYGVFCSSIMWDSIPMWGYYANNHRGFCVGLSVRELFYSGRVGKGGLVQYDEYPLIKPGMSFAEKSSKEIYFKSNDWSHEKEYRLLQIRMGKHENNTLLDDDGNLIGIKTYANESWYREILIGVNTSAEDTEAIIRSCRSKISAGAKIFKLKKQNHDFELIREEIDPTQYL